MSRHTKLFSFIGLIAALTVSKFAGAEFIAVHTVHAQAASDAIMTGIATIATTAITVMEVLTWVLFWFLNTVMSPDLIFYSGISDTLHGIWQFCRDMVNIAFMFMFIAGAIITVVTSSTEKVKSTLPKFVLAVILVNFSWFIPRVIYDVASVVTYTVYQIPSLFAPQTRCTMPTKDGKGVEDCKYVQEIRFFPDDQEKPSPVDGPAPEGGTWECKKPFLCIRFGLLKDAGGGQNETLNGLIVNYSRLRTLAYMADPRQNAAGPPQNAANVAKFTIKILIIFLVYVALFFPIAAMTVAFFIRIPVIWLTIAFMPFVALGFVLDNLSFVIEQIGKRFVTAAFLPAMVGVPFAVGYILLQETQSIQPPAAFNNTQWPVFLGVNDLWQFMWMLIAFGILWVGVFAALKKDEIMGHFSGAIESYGKALGQLAIKGPASIPFIPMPAPKGGGPAQKMSASQMMSMASPSQKLADMQMKARGGASKDPPHITEANRINVSVKNYVQNEISNFKKAGSGQTEADALISKLQSDPKMQWGRLRPDEIVKILDTDRARQELNLTEADTRKLASLITSRATAAPTATPPPAVTPPTPTPPPTTPPTRPTP